MPTGAGARTARTAGGDYSATTQGVPAPVWNRKGAPRGTRSLVFSRRLAPIRHPARNTSTHSWAHARIPLDAPRGGPGRRAARPGEAHSRADPIGRPARTPSTRFMYSHTRGTAVITAQSPASRQQARSKHSRSARGDRTATVSSRKHPGDPQGVVSGYSFGSASGIYSPPVKGTRKHEAA